ncbi:MAG: LacI family DNA-binding transcriptional regulator [Thermoanaerobaculia bacterium]
MSSSPSIREVARFAKVSVATISRVLNGKGAIRESTRTHVLAAIAELGYVPHSAARSLSTRRTLSLGVVLPDLHGEFFSELIRGIDLAARRTGYHILVSGSHSKSAEANAVLAALHGRVDGLIVMSPVQQPADAKAAKAARPSIPPGVPVVMLNAADETSLHDSIRIDNRGGARALVEHLLYLGHRRIAMISGPEGNLDAAERMLGYREALAARDVPFVEEWVLAGDFREESGFRAGQRILELESRPTAIFAANDAMAIGCFAAVRERGLEVPGDISIAGFDDVPMSRYLSPGLTSVRVAIAELGARAVERLLIAVDAVGERPRHHEVVAATLVPRGSTAPPGGPTQSTATPRRNSR